MTSDIPPFQKIVIGIILAFVMASNFGIAVFILKKKFADLKAMNIFQSNYFVGLGLIGITAVLSGNEIFGSKKSLKMTLNFNKNP